ncbi:hypothetical protein DFH06DRAFT_1344816 [Mycena polygramma]|nr:hypothetical protein DFH06DRAFT_1344816 [Mycena polygramma]
MRVAGCIALALCLPVVLGVGQHDRRLPLGKKLTAVSSTKPLATTPKAKTTTMVTPKTTTPKTTTHTTAKSTPQSTPHAPGHTHQAGSDDIQIHRSCNTNDDTTSRSKLPTASAPVASPNVMRPVSSATHPAVPSSSALASSGPATASASAFCGPVPTNTIAAVPSSLPNQYIVSLTPKTNLASHLSNVQRVLASDAQCHDPGPPTGSINTQEEIQDDTV